MTKFLISNPNLPPTITVDSIETMVLGINDDWVVFEEQNRDLFNSWFSRRGAERYIEQYELEGCVVIELEN